MALEGNFCSLAPTAATPSAWKRGMSGTVDHAAVSPDCVMLRCFCRSQDTFVPALEPSLGHGQRTARRSGLMVQCRCYPAVRPSTHQHRHGRPSFHRGRRAADGIAHRLGSANKRLGRIRIATPCGCRSRAFEGVFFFPLPLWRSENNPKWRRVHPALIDAGALVQSNAFRLAVSSKSPEVER